MSKIKVQDIEPIGGTSPAITVNDNRNVDFSAGVSATSFTGDGANLTNLPVDLSNLDAANLTSGSIPDARFPSTLPAVDGSNLTGISGGALEHVADYHVPTGTSVTTWQIGSLGVPADVFPIDTVYLLRGQLKNAYNSSGPDLDIYPEIYDSSSGNTWSWNTGLSYCDTVTTYYGPGMTSNQSSSYWRVYVGGYNDYHFNFEMLFSTYQGVWAHTKLRGLWSASLMTDGNHIWTYNTMTSRIQGLTIYNSYGYPWDDKSKLSLYKYTNY